jgi:hypothetical protein
MKKVEELDVFKLSHSLALEIFEITKSFPEEEKIRTYIPDEESSLFYPNKPNGRSASSEFKGISAICRDC